MKPFHFPLQKVLEWRRTELELAEVRCKRAGAELSAIDQARQELRSSADRAESQLRSRTAIDGCDLGVHSEYREAVKKQDRQLASRRIEAQKKLEAERRAMLEARRRCRLLERLSERRLKEWQAERDREVEETAAESYLARWARRQA